MRRLFIALLAAVSALSGCGLAPEGLEAIQIGGKAYRTGFYGALHPSEYALTEQVLQAEDLTLVRIAHERFELYHADVGPYTEGTIYCEESQCAQAREYYGNPANYRYFCTLGVNRTGGTRAQTVELSDVDAARFDDLLRFAEASAYDPFDERHNSEVETVELPMPDDAVDTRMVFYKESDDGLFRSAKSGDFYIVDGALYRTYQYDYGHGKYERWLAVRAPEELSDCFVSLMEPYLK